jgi:hypothetical protein
MIGATGYPLSHIAQITRSHKMYFMAYLEGFCYQLERFRQMVH